MNIKTIILAVITALVVGLCAKIYTQSMQIKDLKSDLTLSANNLKAYESQVDSLEGNTIQFQMNIAQLNYSKDSLIQKLNQVKKQLNVKDKKITELQYIASENRKVDSVFVRDTIFKNPKFVMDTTIGDK